MIIVHVNICNNDFRKRNKLNNDVILLFNKKKVIKE